MPDLENDPLWYDRVEPCEPPGLVIRVTAVLFLAACAIYHVPDQLYVACERFVRRGQARI